MKHLEKFEDFKTRKEIEELDIFDFNNIPMSELDKAYIDYEPLYDTVDWYSVDEDYLYEERKINTTGIQSAVDVVSRAMNQLKMSEFQIKAKSPNGVEYIEVKRLMEDYPDWIHKRQWRQDILDKIDISDGGYLDHKFKVDNSVNKS